MSATAIPSYRTPIYTKDKGEMERTWYKFFTDIWKGLPSAPVVSITATVSPFVYQSTSKGFMIVNGGTVSLIQFTRDGITNYPTGQTNGVFPLAQGDSLIVVYSVVPMLTWVPL